MVILLSVNSSHPLVEGSATVAVVSVSVSPQSKPLEFYFTDRSAALGLVSRLSEPDGLDYARSLASYKDK